MIWRMNSISPVDPTLETKLRIAFQEGVIKAQEYLVTKFEKFVTPK